MKKLFSLAAILSVLTTQAFAVGKVQQQGVKTATDCTNAGASLAQCLLLDQQIWDSTNSQQLSQSIATGALGGGGGGGGINLLASSDNPGFEQGTTGWTASGGSFSAISSGQLYGAKSGQFTASASSQTLYSALKAVSAQPALAGNNCLAAISYSYASGTSGDYSMVVSDGTNVLATLSLGVTTSVQDVPLSFACPASGSVKVGVISNVSSPSAIKLDGASFNGGSVLLGSNVLLNNISQSSFYGSILYPNTSGQVWTTTSSTFANYSANASIGAPTVSGNAVAPATKIPGAQFNSLPPGEYMVVVQGTLKQINNSDECVWRISDGTTGSGQMLFNSISGAGYANTLIGRFNYSTTQSSTTFQVQAGRYGGTGSCDIQLQNTVDTFDLRVYRFPTSTQQSYSASQVPASWSGYHTVSSGWSSSSTTFADASSGSSISLTQTTARNMSCTADATLPAVNCVLPRSGMWRVKAIPILQTIGAAAQNSARLVDGTGTIIDPGHTTVDGAGGNHTPLPLEGLYFNTSAGATVKFKVQISNNNGNAVSVVNGIPTGAAAIQWVVEDADATNAAPVLVGTVTTSSAGLERVERVIAGGSGSIASPTSCSTSPCTIYKSSPGISSVTRIGTGSYAVNFVAGTFSDVPTCNCNIDGNDGISCTTTDKNGVSATQKKFNSYRDFTTSIDSVVNITCTGPH